LKISNLSFDFCNCETFLIQNLVFGRTGWRGGKGPHGHVVPTPRSKGNEQGTGAHGSSGKRTHHVKDNGGPKMFPVILAAAAARR
jgi:hypothetical protein